MKKISISAFTNLPSFVQLIFIATAIAVTGGKEILGYRISGLTWFVPLVISIFYFILRMQKVSFPWKLWAPWVFLLLFWLPVTEYSSLQRTAQLLCPLLIGMCASTIRATNYDIANFLQASRHFAILLLIITLGKSGMHFFGKIPYNPGLAAELMPSLLLCSVFATSYTYGRTKDLFLWILLCVLPVFGLFRSGIAVAGITLPFTFAPLQKKKRLFFILAAIPIGFWIFYLPTVQREMFHSGQGAIQDILSTDFATSGREAMWKVVRHGITQEPLFGHGTGACEDLVVKFTGGLRYPHNDWLLTAYDYGYFGGVLFGLTILVALLHAYRQALKSDTAELRILFHAGAFSFVILALMMLTDNIMVYASFFGNFQFTILGLAYAGLRTQEIARWQQSALRRQ